MLKVTKKPGFHPLFRRYIFGGQIYFLAFLSLRKRYIIDAW